MINLELEELKNTHLHKNIFYPLGIENIMDSKHKVGKYLHNKSRRSNMGSFYNPNFISFLKLFSFYGLHFVSIFLHCSLVSVQTIVLHFGRVCEDSPIVSIVGRHFSLTVLLVDVPKLLTTL
jgi:hypothetical protein